MNIWNFTKFHRYMVEQGYIRASDMNVNILQNPEEYRIDILPHDIKLKLKKEFEDHLVWLRKHDRFLRATGGFEAAINFMMADDKSHLLPNFWRTTSDLDWSRSEKLIDVVPELAQLLEYKPSNTRT